MAAVDTDEVLYDVADGVATITLNRPAQLNAISMAMLEALSETPGERIAYPGKTRMADTTYVHARIPTKCRKLRPSKASRLEAVAPRSPKPKRLTRTAWSQSP